MLPLMPSLLSGASSLIGSIFSSDTSAQNTQAQIAGQQAMQKESETFNAGEAQKNRDYQTQMSNTAFQRARQDAMAAGLNPMVLAGMGGASSPGGNAASIGTPTMPTPQRTSPLAGIGDAVSKAVSTAVSAKTMDKMTEEIANLQTEQAKNAAETSLVKQRTGTEREETLKRSVEASLEQLKLPGARFSAKSAEDLEALPEWLRKSVSQGGYVGAGASKAISPITDLISSAKGIYGMLPKSKTSWGSSDGPGGTRTWEMEDRYGAAFPR